MIVLCPIRAYVVDHLYKQIFVWSIHKIKWLFNLLLCLLVAQSIIQALSGNLHWRLKPLKILFQHILCSFWFWPSGQPLKRKWPPRAPLNIQMITQSLLGSSRKVITHDDVVLWKHFLRNWPFVRGIHRSPVNSPQKGQWRGALIFSLICACINGWINNREAGNLRCHHVHYDVTVMNEVPVVPS